MTLNDAKRRQLEAPAAKISPGLVAPNLWCAQDNSASKVEIGTLQNQAWEPPNLQFPGLASNRNLHFPFRCNVQTSLRTVICGLGLLYCCSLRKTAFTNFASHSPPERSSVKPRARCMASPREPLRNTSIIAGTACNSWPVSVDCTVNAWLFSCAVHCLVIVCILSDVPCHALWNSGSCHTCNKCHKHFSLCNLLLNTRRHFATATPAQKISSPAAATEHRKSRPTLGIFNLKINQRDDSTSAVRGSRAKECMQ